MPTIARFAVVLGLASSGLGCARSQSCLVAGECAAGRSCVVSSCRPSQELVAPQASRRLQMYPDQIAVVTSRGPQPWTGAEVPFGSTEAGRVVLLMRFSNPLHAESRIAAAELRLDPLPSALPGRGPVAVSVAGTQAPWTPSDVSWQRMPTLEVAGQSKQVAVWGGRPAVIDVTDVVRAWREARAGAQTLVLAAEPHDPIGAQYALGIAGGRAPRLDVYLR